MPVLGMYSQSEVIHALGVEERNWRLIYRPPKRKTFMGVEIPQHTKMQNKFIVYGQEDARIFIEAVAETRARLYSYRDLIPHLGQYRYVKLRDNELLCEYPIEPIIYNGEYNNKYWWPRVNVLIVMHEITSGKHRPREDYLNDYLIDGEVPTPEQLEQIYNIPNDLGGIMKYKPLRSVTA